MFENQEICSQKRKKITQKSVLDVLQFSNRTRLVKTNKFPLKCCNNTEEINKNVNHISVN